MLRPDSRTFVFTERASSSGVPDSRLVNESSQVLFEASSWLKGGGRLYQQAGSWAEPASAGSCTPGRHNLPEALDSHAAVCGGVCALIKLQPIGWCA